jgi:hypothetical protein
MSSMLSGREKELVTLAYYHGTCDNAILNDAAIDIPLHRKSVGLATEKVLNELGLDLPDPKEFMDFMKELEVITQYLLKEDEFAE